MAKLKNSLENQGPVLKKRLNATPGFGIPDSTPPRRKQVPGETKLHRLFAPVLANTEREQTRAARKGLTLLAWPRYARTNAKGCTPVWFTLKRGGKRIEFHSGLFIPPAGQLIQEDRLILGDPVATARLQVLFHHFEQIRDSVYLSGEDVDLQQARAQILNHGRPVTPTAMQTMAEFYRVRYEMRPGQFEPLTTKTVRRNLINLQRFIREALGKEDISLGELNLPAIVYKLNAYFFEVRRMKASTGSRTIKEMKRILAFAFDNGWIKSNALGSWRGDFACAPKQGLTMGQLDALRALKLPTYAEVLGLDLAIFQAKTGLSHCDLARLRPEHLHTTPEGAAYLLICRKKTGVASMPPVDAELLSIIERHASNPRRRGYLLPVPALQVRNRMLKVLGERIHLDFPLATHNLRVTAASNLVNVHNVPLDDVARVLGHQSPNTTRRFYVRIKPETVVVRVNSLTLTPPKP